MDNKRIKKVFRWRPSADAVESEVVEVIIDFQGVPERHVYAKAASAIVVDLQRELRPSTTRAKDGTVITKPPVRPDGIPSGTVIPAGQYCPDPDAPTPVRTSAKDVLIAELRAQIAELRAQMGASAE